MLIRGLLCACVTAGLSLSGMQSGSSTPQTSPKQKRKAEKKLAKELQSSFNDWLSNDVAYIITPEERQAFTDLSTDGERENFIESFWLRRDPTPDTEENEYKEEHYRRLAFANEHFASGVPGWRTDRGHIYILHGAPDEIESHPSGGAYTRTIEEGGGQTSTFAFERWRYRHLDGVGDDVVLEFVDRSGSGEYRLTTDPNEKDALLYVPNAGPTFAEQIGTSTKGARISGIQDPNAPASANEFTRLELMANVLRPPRPKDRALEAVVDSNLRFNMLPMKVRVDYIPVTSGSVFALITMQFDRKDLQFRIQNGTASATVNIYARITTLARRTATWFEAPISIDVSPDMLESALRGSAMFEKTVPLPPGRYRLNIVAKDLVGGNMTTYEQALDVPRLDETTLSASSLIVADIIEPISTREIGTGAFVIGGTKVRPRVGETFSTDENLGIYIQFYNFQADAKTNRAVGTVELQILDSGSNRPVLQLTDDAGKLEGSASQLTVKKVLPLRALAPGAYTLILKAMDQNSGRTLTRTARFHVTN